MKQILCPKCNSQLGLFGVFVVSGNDTDNHTYIELCCYRCDKEMQFVVDLTPEFERNEV